MIELIGKQYAANACNADYAESFFYSTSEGLYPLYCGWQRCEPGHCYGPHMRDHHYYHIILRGRGMLFKAKSEYTLTRGCGFMAFPDELVTYRADPDDPWEYLWVAFRGSQVTQLVENAGLSVAQPVYIHGPDDQMDSVIWQIIQCGFVNTYSSFLQAIGYSYQFFSLFRGITNTQRAQRVNPTEHLLKAVAYIKENCNRGQELTVQAIADHVGVSSQYINKLFKREYGITTKGFINEYRLCLIFTYFTNSNKSVGEVAGLAGFQDPLYFSRWFKKELGMSPKKFRDNCKSNTDMASLQSLHPLVPELLGKMLKRN